MPIAMPELISKRPENHWWVTVLWPFYDGKHHNLR
jgi:hypothetical protein